MPKNTKLMGGIGLILMSLGFIPDIGFIVSLIGTVLTLVAYNWLSKEYREIKIFSNALWAVLLPFLGSFALALALGIFIATLVLNSIISIDFLNNINDFSFLSQYLWVVWVILTFWILLCIFVIISGKKWREADRIIAEKSGENLFRTGGDLIYIGSWIVVILIGIPVVIIGNIVKIVAFFSVKEL